MNRGRNTNIRKQIQNQYNPLKKGNNQAMNE